MKIPGLICWILSNLVTIGFSQETPVEFEKQYEIRIKKERINDVYIPLDVQDAIKELDRLTDKKSTAILLNNTEDTVASKLHFSLGRWISIHWGLEEGSRLSHHLKSRGLSYPDDMMDFLIRIWHRHLCKKPWDEELLIESYIKKRRAEFLKKFKSIDTIDIKLKKE
jgi:hypothetical protein